MISAILLAGGAGTRMCSSLPKVFLPIHSIPMVIYSLSTLVSVDEIDEVVIVSPAEYQSIFTKYKYNKKITFASPGKERMLSVLSGLKKLKNAKKILIHDAARPFLKKEEVEHLIEQASNREAVTLGSPLSNAIKKVNSEVIQTHLPKKEMWESYTPQIINKKLLEKGISYCLQHDINPEDDVEMLSYVGTSAHMIRSNRLNIKITTPRDRIFFTLLEPLSHV